MTDTLSIVQSAAWRAVSAGVGFPFFVTVPQNTKPPFGKIGTIEAEDAGEKAVGLERFEVEIVYIYQGREKADLTAMMGEGRAALTQSTLADDAVQFSTPRWLSSVASDASPQDGITYAGISRFEIYAAPADAGE